MNDAELLREWMDKQDGGLTQAQAAERLGMSQPGVYAVLSGKSKLSGIGRRFVKHLIADLDAQQPSLDALRKIWRLSAENLPQEYLDDSYLVAKKKRANR